MTFLISYLPVHIFLEVVQLTVNYLFVHQLYQCAQLLFSRKLSFLSYIINQKYSGSQCGMLCFVCFFIQFNVPFKIISIMGRNGSTPEKPPDTPASRTCLVSHVASAGLEPTPDTAVR